MDFIATAPAETSETVTNEGWFPDIALPPLRSVMRLDGTVTLPRLIDAVSAAIACANSELRDWQCEQQQAGYASLSAVPGSQVNGENARLLFYRRAIYYFVKAELIEQYRDFDSTHTGEKQAERLAITIESDRRSARWALSDLRQSSRTTVELI